MSSYFNLRFRYFRFDRFPYIIAPMQVLRQGMLRHLKVNAFLAGAILSAVVFGVGSIALFASTYQGKIYEGIMIDSVNVSGLTKPQALVKLNQQTLPPLTQQITLSVGTTTVASSAADLGLHKEYDSAISQAFQYGRSQGLVQNMKNVLGSYVQGRNFTAPLAFDPLKVQDFVTLLSTQVHQSGESPYAQLKNGFVEIFPGKMGQALVIEDETKQILLSANGTNTQFTAQLKPNGIQLSQIQIDEAKARAEKFVGKSIEGKYDITRINLDDVTLVNMLAFPTGYNDQSVEKVITLFKEKIDRPAQNAKFSYDEQTMKVKEFTPDLDGLTIDPVQAKNALTTTLQTIESGSPEKLLSLTIPTATKKADVTLASLNTIGLKERVAFGESLYQHSIPTRVFNVSLASKIVNNTIVKPGEEFSFNKALGEVSKETGFQPAYVIKSGQTVLGDGGGVCQVSTTLFRALLDGGMNITKRKAHSYRVSYYELNKDPGFDATVYSGDVDLRFINDTPGALLLHFETFPEERHMFVSIYGTSDGRKSQISEYKKWDAKPAAPTEYIDDPTLPPGKLVQIDFAVGGIKAQFKYTVRDKDGNVKYENTYYSNYIPWSAKYRRGV